ncbi:uncharacterized protein perm1a [Brachyhypopomus gauderio]|uniref:uncharacterized protein perm1a n=1 Tax=Brachyhypopomus gauderio TaxID=698409 RepID=UPI0040416E7B
MDEFDYSVHISERDWYTFFHECEECDLLPPSLAGLDDSGMSDMDEAGSQRARPLTEDRLPDAELQIDGGSPVERVLSECGLGGPDRVLSGSEEDLHSETINVFFERLKDFSRSENGAMNRRRSTEGGETAGHSEEGVEQAEGTSATRHEDPILSSSRDADQRNETVAQNTTYTCRHNQPATNNLDVDPCIWTCPEPQCHANREDRLQETMWECGDLNHAVHLNPDFEKTPSCALVSGFIELTANSQLGGNCNSDCKELEAGQCQCSSSTPRRKRRRKKRASSESVQPDHRLETPFPDKHSESEDDSYMQRCEVLRETWTSGVGSSDTISEAHHTSSPQTVGVSYLQVQTQPLPGDADITKPTMVHPNSPKADQGIVKSASIVSVVHTGLRSQKEPRTGAEEPSREFAIREEFLSPESGDKEQKHAVVQSDASSTAPTSGGNTDNHSQLDLHMPSQKETALKASENVPVFVSDCDTERAASKLKARQPAISENLSLLGGEWKEDQVSVLHHTAIAVKSSADITALQSPTLLPSDRTGQTPVSPQRQAGERLTSYPQENRPDTAYQWKSTVTISCLAFPELKEERALTTCYNNAEKEEGLNCMSHDRVTPEHRNDEETGMDSLSEMCDSELQPQSDSQNVAKVQFSHQSAEMNASNIQMESGQSSLNLPSGDTIKNAYLSELKTEKNYVESEKPAVLNESENGRLPCNSQNDDWTEEVCPFLDIHGSKEDQNFREAESLCPTAEARNEGLSIKEPSEECQSLLHTTDPMRESVRDYKLDPNPSIIITTSEEEKDQIHKYVFPSKEHESASAVMQGALASSLESRAEAGDTEPECSATTDQPTPPPYAISSFWNEMEKLTINDILRLRLVGQAQHPGVLLQPEDSNTADASDAADSGYFTHLDDSKPDRSSGDMSCMSDFDEDLAQLQAQDLAKLGEGSRESPDPGGDVVWESQLEAAGMEDVFMLSSETALPLPLYRDSSQQCFRKMCKNISVQNLQTYDARPLGKILRNASLRSLHSVSPVHAVHSDEYEDPFDRVDRESSPVFFSDEEEEESESPGITFSEIIQFLFGTDEPEPRASVDDNITHSYLEGTGTSVPETYDHFFSEFEAESFFYPLETSGNDELVPIFSCSRPATKTHQFPEVYDYFFPDDSPTHSDEDEDHEQTAKQLETQCDCTATQSHSTSTASDTYEQVATESSYTWNLLWKNPLSFRRAQRASSMEPSEGSISWALTPMNKSGRAFQGGIQPVAATPPGERSRPDPLLLGLETNICRQLVQQQKICSEMQTAVVDPRLDASLMPLKQADMCLVCIAFASWVLKSVNPQGADTWKAALLANVSALSAIRYLRRYMRDEANKKPPLLQIEPA